MKMAKLIANERISYKVIPQSLPKSNSSINWLSSGDAALESGTSKNQYNIDISFCIVGLFFSIVFFCAIQS